MPALTNVSLLDRETTPVAHVFVPRDVKNGTGLLVRSTGVALGEERFTLSNRKVGGRFRGRMTIAVPIVVTEIINGVSIPRVIDTDYLEISTNFSEYSTTQRRTNIVGMAEKSLAASLLFVHNTLVGQEGVYGS